MRKVFIQCPLCKQHEERDDCALATFRRVVEDKVYVYCCEALVKKDKNE